MSAAGVNWTTERRVRPAAIAYGAVVSVAAVTLSFVVMAATPGDGESKLWAAYAWQFTFFPVTLVLGIASVAMYDRWSRLQGKLARLALLLANVSAVAAIPYPVILGLASIASRGE